MAEAQIQEWCDNGDRNSEYISIDTDFDGAVPSNNIALSLAGLFTFFISTTSPFTVSLPNQYKKSAALNEFVTLTNKSKGATVATALDAATKAYPKIADARDAEVNAEENNNEDDDATQEDDFFVQPSKDPEVLAKEAARKAADRQLAELRELYAPKTSLPPATVERLLKDLTHVQRVKHHGWSAQPSQGNLAIWEVKLFDFDKDTPLFNDIQSLKSRSGEDFITMHMKFPPGYPNKPPFVRVVRPRFAFRTGRVTVGGSLCTELLVQEGWQPVYDIESIIESLRQQITDKEAGARVDFNNTQPYTEEEAIEAFNRVARDHGWSVM